MGAAFYLSSAVALLSTFLVITRKNAAHAALYLVVSLLSVAVLFFSLGAPFIGALEIIVYAGAIMVLFLFVIMLLNLGKAAVEQERRLLGPRMWVGPALLAGILLVEMVFLLTREPGAEAGTAIVGAREVAREMFGPYVLGVELASMLLLAGLVGAYHLRSRGEQKEEGT